MKKLQNFLEKNCESEMSICAKIPCANEKWLAVKCRLVFISEALHSELCINVQNGLLEFEQATVFRFKNESIQQPMLLIRHVQVCRTEFVA